MLKESSSLFKILQEKQISMKQLKTLKFPITNSHWNWNRDSTEVVISVRSLKTDDWQQAISKSHWNDYIQSFYLTP